MDASPPDAGPPFLARPPRLREVHLDGLPGVTFEGTKIFPAHVRVDYSTLNNSQAGSLPPGCQSWIGLPSGSDSLAKRPFG